MRQFGLKWLLRKKILYGLFAIFSITSVWVFNKHHRKSTAVFQPPKTLVSVQLVKKSNLIHHLSYMGNLRSSNTVILTPEINGIIESIAFYSGEFVKKGSLLLTLKHEQENADLEKAKAQYDQIHDQYQRSKKLYADKIIPQVGIVQLESKLKVAKANLDQAQTALDRCFIKAPFIGKLGIRNVNIGQYIQPGDKIANLVSIPVSFVDFNVPSNVANLLLNSAQLTLILQGYTKPIKAKIVTMDCVVDQNTQTIAIRAKISNKLVAIQSGSVAKVLINIPYKNQGMLISEHAVQYEPYGALVYIVNHGIANLHYIQTQQYQGNLVLVTSGLKSGDKVVTAGQDKLHDGDKVIVS